MIRLVVLGIFAATLAGCTENVSILILRNVKAGDMCVADAEGTVGQSRGILDVTNPLPDGTINLGYTLTPAISNTAVAGMMSSTNPTNPSAHIFFLQGAKVELLPGPNERSRQLIATLQTAGLDKREVRIGGSIGPGESAAVSFEVIDFEQVDVMSQLLGEELTTVVAKVQVFGSRDDSDVESLPFEYPITVCRGCLLIDAGPCAMLEMGAELPTGGECGLLQDENLACCTLASGTAKCPATVPMSM